MHNSLIVQVAIMALILCAAIAGYLLAGLFYVLQPESPVLPLACFAIIILSMWAARELLD